MRHKRGCRINASYSGYFGCEAVTINPGLTPFWPPLCGLFDIGRRDGLSIHLRSNGKISENWSTEAPLGGNGSHVQSNPALSRWNCPQIGPETA